MARKVALITGSSRGIGRAAAARLAREGYAVCINYIEREDKAEELVRELRAEGMPLKPGILTVDEFVEEVERLCPLKSAT